MNTSLSSATVAQLLRRDAALDAARVAERLDFFVGKTPTPGPGPIEHQPNQHQGSEPQSVPEVEANDLTDEKLKSAMATRGCLLVRGLFSRPAISEYCEVIDRVMGFADQGELAGTDHDPLQKTFANAPQCLPNLLREPRLSASRKFHRDGGSAMCVESSGVCEQLLALYESAGIKRLVHSYLGEEPCLSALKWVLRRPRLPVNPDGWHQDGAFMGKHINSLNMWLAASTCGGQSGAPGMDILPYRLTDILGAGEEGAIFDWSVGDKAVKERLGAGKTEAPLFEAGDALFFDHFLLHRTQHGEDFIRPRYAIETWFFDSKNFPENQVPLRW